MSCSFGGRVLGARRAVREAHLASLGFIVVCDSCGRDGGSTQLTYDEAVAYGGGWEQPDGLHLCGECQAPEDIPEVPENGWYLYPPSNA